MNWLKVLTAKQMFGRVLTKYINEPISCWYYLGFSNSEFEESIFLMLDTIEVGHQSVVLHPESL
jgi:hypothetical protein